MSRSRLQKILKEKGFVVIVSLPRNEEALADAAVAAGVDAIKAHLNVRHRASGTVFKSWEHEKARLTGIIRSAAVPVGLMPGADATPTRGEMDQAIAAGIDFIDIYDFHMPCWMLELGVYKMVAFGPDHSRERLKAVEALGADALEASLIPPAEYGKPLTVADLERYRLLTSAAKIPVFVPSQKKIAPEDLPALKKIGIAGVILGAVSLGRTPRSFQERLPAFVRA